MINIVLLTLVCIDACSNALMWSASRKNLKYIDDLETKVSNLENLVVLQEQKNIK